MLSWLHRSFIRMTIANTVLLLTICMGATVAAALGFQLRVERLYDDIIFDRIVPDVQHIPERIGAAEEQAITNGEAGITLATIDKAKGMGQVTAEESWPADSFRDHVSDRRARGGLDKKGSLFIFASDANDKLTLYQGMHAADGTFQAVHAITIAIPKAGAALDELSAFRAEQSSKLDEQRAKFADLEIALGKVRVMVNNTIDAVNASRQNLRTVKSQWMEIIAALLVSLLTAGILGMVLLLRRQSRIIVNLRGAMTHIISARENDAELAAIEVPGTERPDEIGEMSRAVQIFQKQAIIVHQMTEEIETERQRNEVERRVALLEMAARVERETAEAVGRVTSESQEMLATAGSMANSAVLVEENAQHVTQAAEQSLVNTQAVARASGELSESIRDIARQVARSRQIVGETVRAAGTASSSVMSLSEAMSAIDQVVLVIADIASQTNLLALNATIEAARAGDAGKGFAVVANEVKVLANQTARQTDDISKRISTLKEMATQVTHAIGDVTGRITGVEEIANLVATAVELQDVATKEIARNVQDSSQAAKVVVDRIAQVAAEASATGQQAIQVQKGLTVVTRQVGDLSQLLNRVILSATDDADRREVRHDVEAPVEVNDTSGQHYVGTLKNISLHGAQIEGLPPTDIGEPISVSVDGLHITARVLAVQGDVWRIQMDKGQSQAVEAWIKAHIPKEIPAKVA